MTFDELNEDQRTELKQCILMERNEHIGEGTSYKELALADDLISDEDLRELCEGTEFSEDDFTCPVFKVRVTWPVYKTFRVPAYYRAEALERIKCAVENGSLSYRDPGWEDDSGDGVPKIEIVED